MIYLDHAATSPICPIAQQAMISCYQDAFYNPSAVYAPAVVASRLLSSARQTIAAQLSCNANQILFTSGGTEAIGMAIVGTANRRWSRPATFLSFETEHPAVLENLKYLQARGMPVQILPVLPNGKADMDALEVALQQEVAMLCVQQVNSETGCVQDIKQIVQMVRKIQPKALVLVDAVQAFMRLDIPSDVDFVAISAHKIHGPRGVGALRVPIGAQLPGVALGGGQEFALRSGTENLPGIVGFAAAVQDYPADTARAMQKLKQDLWDRIATVGDIVCNGPSIHETVPHILHVSVKGVRGEVLLHMLEEKGVYVGKGSACSSKKSQKSSVLTAMKLPTWALDGAVRLSISRMTKKEEIIEAASLFCDAVQTLRSRGG